jgi:hypothetical protein
MLFPTAPTLLNLLVLNTTLDAFNPVHQSCLADRYYGTYDGQSLFMLDSDFHCDPSGPGLELGRESDTISVYPHHELLFLKKMEIEGAIVDEAALFGGLERLAAQTRDSDGAATPGAQWPLTNHAPMYSIPYHKGYSAILSISPHLLPYIDQALPPSYKAYALPKIPLPLRRVPEEAKGRIRRWTDSVEYDDDIDRIVKGLPVSQLLRDVRYLTGEDPGSPILSRSSFSEGARLAAEWILEQIEETGAYCELKQFLPGFAPNVVWCVTSSRSYAVSQRKRSSASEYESLDESAGTIILSSHYDSRGSLGNPRRAPGGNDNGGYL